jgi:hypothetical protein
MRSQALVRGIALAAAGTGFVWIFLARFHPPLVLLNEVGRPAAAAVIILLAVLAAGVASISIARRVFSASAEPVALADALLVGYPVFGTVIGAMAWVSTAPVVPATLAVAAFGVAILLRQRDAIRFAAPPLLLSIPIALAIIEAITPVNSPDELIYKLAVPQQYLLYGRMIELPLNSDSYLTFGTSLTDLAALALGGGIAAKLARLALYLASLAVLQRFGRRLAGDSATWITAVVAWTPTLMLIAGWAWNEWIVIGLIVLAMDRWERWLDLRHPSDAAIAFAAAGGAIATKYTALPWLAAFVVIVLLRSRDTRFMARAALVIALFGGFFYVRNAAWTGSPFAPLLLPNSPKIDNYRSGSRFSGWTNILHGYEIFDPALLDESLGILMPLAAVAALALIGRRDRIARDLLIAGGVQMPILLTIAPTSRNMVVGVLPLAIAGAALTAELWRRSARPLRAALACGAGVALGAQLILVAYSFESMEVVPYLIGRERIVAYLTRMRSFMRPYEWIARSTPPASRILLLGESRILYLERQAVSGGNLDGPRIAVWLARFHDLNALGSELRRLGITHILIGTQNYHIGGGQPGMIEKEVVLQLSPSADALLEAFVAQRAVLRYRDARYLIFELR